MRQEGLSKGMKKWKFCGKKMECPALPKEKAGRKRQRETGQLNMLVRVIWVRVSSSKKKRMAGPRPS